MKAKHLILLASIATAPSYANEPLITLQLSQGSYKTNDSKDGTLYSVHAKILIESDTGSFHRAAVNGSFDSSASTSVGSDRLQNIEYNLGTFWYPKASANDYSIWSGLGHWQLTDTTSATEERIGKIAYIPLGFEGGSIISDSHYYFVYGADIKALVSSTVEINSVRIKEASGYGYALWLGFDHQFEDGTVFEMKLKRDKVVIDEADYEFSSNNLILGYRF
jgi:hypothetical protein